jgi:hypothetical protein
MKVGGKFIGSSNSVPGHLWTVTKLNKERVWTKCKRTKQKRNYSMKAFVFLLCTGKIQYKKGN